MTLGTSDCSRVDRWKWGDRITWVSVRADQLAKSRSVLRSIGGKACSLKSLQPLESCTQCPALKSNKRTPKGEGISAAFCCHPTLLTVTFLCLDFPQLLFPHLCQALTLTLTGGIGLRSLQLHHSAHAAERPHPPKIRITSMNLGSSCFGSQSHLLAPRVLLQCQCCLAPYISPYSSPTVSGSPT